MATTATKMVFSLRDLRESALAIMDRRIGEANQVLRTEYNLDTLEERVQQWQEEQERKVLQFADSIADGEVSQEELAAFRIEPKPGFTTWERRVKENEIRQLEDQRDAIEAKVDALQADADGNVELTKSQLRDNFGL